MLCITPISCIVPSTCSLTMVLVEEHKSAMTIIINLLLLLLFLHGL